MTALINEETIERLYAAFAAKNGAAMTACYAKGAHFRDPAFGDLEGDDIGAMWRMLTGRARDLKVTLREHDADETTGTAHWLATYTFSTGRHVEKDLQAPFTVDQAGLITAPVDDFDFHKWASQALGPKGHLVALLPPLRKKARAQALGQLTPFKRDASPA